MIFTATATAFVWSLKPVLSNITCSVDETATCQFIPVYCPR